MFAIDSVGFKSKLSIDAFDILSSIIFSSPSFDTFTYPSGITANLQAPASSIGISSMAHATEDLCNAQFPQFTPIELFSLFAPSTYPTQIPLALSSGPTLFDKANKASANALSSFDNSSYSGLPSHISSLIILK